MSSDSYAQGSAARFASRLRAHGSADVRRQLGRHFRAVDPTWGAYERALIGVRIERVIGLAREYIGLQPAQIEALLCFEEHEIRAGGLWVMGRQARAALPFRQVRGQDRPDRLGEMYELYLRRIDRIDNWDLVDLAAPDVVGGHLLNRPRGVLYELARSTNRWERRTALLAAFRLAQAGDLEDACALCCILSSDPDDLVQVSVGGVLREVGRWDRPRLQEVLEGVSTRLGRVALRYAVDGLRS